MTEPMDATVDLLAGMEFKGRTGSGHTIVMDAMPDVGGRDAGPRPLELLLVGLGGCTGMDVISILRKMRQNVTGYQIQLHADRAADHPKGFTHITIEHIVRGENLSPESVRRAVELTATRYCSASSMIQKAATIEERWQVIDVATGAESAGVVGIATAAA